MEVTAVVLYLAGIVLAFGWRSLAQRRATGDTGLHLDAGSVGGVGWWAKLSFLAAFVLGLVGPAAALAGLPPIGALDRDWLHLTGLTLAVAGVAATWRHRPRWARHGGSGSTRANAPHWSPPVSSPCPATPPSPPCSPPAPAWH